MAMWVMAVVSVAPCQCLWLGGHQITSPARISTRSSPSHWVQPVPEVTISVWPSGWVCQAVLPPGSKLTEAIPIRDAAGGLFKGSIDTSPVYHSDGPFCEARVPARFNSMLSLRCSCRSTDSGVKDARPLNAIAVHRTIQAVNRSAWQARRFQWPLSYLKTQRLRASRCRLSRRLPEFERELAGVEADLRVEHRNLERVGGIEQCLALPDKPEAGRGSLANDLRPLDPVHGLGIGQP